MLILLAMPAVARPPAGQAVLVDRLVAIVGEQALTWRDVEAARLLGSIPATGAAAEAIDRLVTRELMHVEVERLSVAAPIGAAVDERLTRAQQRAGGPEAFTRALRTLGLSEVQAREWVADDLRMDVYVDQRFTAAAQPTDEEVASFFVANAARFAQPGVDADDAATARARAALVEVRRRALIDAWLDGLRRRADIVATPR